MDLSVKIGSRTLSNPVGVASGTFGYGSEYEKLINVSALGAIFTKAITLEPRAGNDIPRIVETPAGILNSIGLANVGVEIFLKEKMEWLSKLPCAIITNIAGSSEDEYARVVDKLESCESIWVMKSTSPALMSNTVAWPLEPILGWFNASPVLCEG
jgi:dihydroorotate dehydrogenase (NAD+) catalytic subunit